MKFLRRIKRIIRRGRVDKKLKRILCVALATVLTVTVAVTNYEHLPKIVTNLAVLSTALALPEGTGGMSKTDTPDLPLTPPPLRDENPPDTEAVSDAIVDIPAAPSYEVDEDDKGRIIEEKFSSTADKNAVVFGNGTIKNYTEKSLESIEKILETPWGETLTNDSQTVQVLIMHTHTTESYEPYDRDFYDVNYSARTLDENFNMIKVGNAIAKTLSENGIGVVHDTTVHDYPSYNGSYDRSAVTVKTWLERYPTIKVVIDVHRDAIERTLNGETVRVKPTTEIDGKKAAQIMIIAGCDDGTMGMPNYKQNLRFAAALQDRIETDSPSLTRPLMFDYRKYNQNLTTGSILVEMGGHANSLDEAVYSGELLGKSLSTLLKTYMDENGEE